jgi:hypothetical protein
MRRDMTVTNFLLVVILLILVEQFYPTVASVLTPAALVLFGLSVLSYLFFVLPDQWKQHRAEKQQRERDEKEYWEYAAKSDALRKKFDPKNEWNEATSVPRAYREELRELHLQYRGMLMRRNDWKDEDFED